MRDQWLDSPLHEYSYRIMSDEVKLQRGDCNLNVAGGFLKLRLLSVEVSAQSGGKALFLGAHAALAPKASCCKQSPWAVLVWFSTSAPLQQKC